MLSIIVPGEEQFNQETNEFYTVGDVTLELEHSLVSLSKWESKFEKPFLGAGEKSVEEIIAYIEAMIVTRKFPPEVFSKFTSENFDAINVYINAKRSATFFSDTIGTTKSREVITSELIYYWMVAYNIPWEAQYWHLNRLFTLIRVCNVKNDNKKPRKQNRSEMIAQRNALNAKRRAEMGSSG